MGQQQRVPAGLYKRGKNWHIDKEIYGKRVSRSTGTTELKEAKAVLNRFTEQARLALIYGIRPQRTFQEAVIKYVKEEELNGKISLDTEIRYINSLLPFIGDIPLESIHDETLKKYIDARKNKPYRVGHKEKGKRKKWRTNRTINYALKIVSQILKRAATKWRDENNLTWLLESPKIQLLPDKVDRRQPYPISWDEQDKLFAILPEHLKKMALFIVNTGCRDGEICSLKWEWERRIPELNTSVFIIPGFIFQKFTQVELNEIDSDGIGAEDLGRYERQIKNGEDRLIVLNRTATEIIESVRGMHSEYVFVFRDKRLYRMNNSGWQAARTAVSLKQVRVHDLRHTYGRRLRAAGISLEDRQDLLGHKSGRITTHYSAAEIGNLIKAAEAASVRHDNSPTLVVLRGCA